MLYCHQDINDSIGVPKSPLPIITSTPHTKWMPPYSTGRQLSSATPTAMPTSLGSLISQLRIFKYPGRPHPPNESDQSLHAVSETTNDSVEITHIETVDDVTTDHTILIESSPPLDHTKPNDSPLLFHSKDVTPLAPDHTPNTINDTTNNDGGVKNEDGVKISKLDTPPLSPHYSSVMKNESDGIINIVKTEEKKSATPLRKTKANTRMASKKMSMASLSGRGQNEISSVDKVLCNNTSLV